MPYIIRKTAESPLWKQFQERAKAEGHSLNWVIWELIRRYVEWGLPKDGIGRIDAEALQEIIKHHQQTD